MRMNDKESFFRKASELSEEHKKIHIVISKSSLWLQKLNADEG